MLKGTPHPQSGRHHQQASFIRTMLDSTESIVSVQADLQGAAKLAIAQKLRESSDGLKQSLLMIF